MHPVTTWFAGTEPRVEQVLVAVLLVVLLAAGARSSWRAIQRGTWRAHRRLAATTAALAVATLAARLAAFPPSFVHANFRGPALVDAMLRWPHPAEELGSYGQATSFLLGAAAASLGRRFEVVATSNAVAGVVALVLAGALAARWTGRLRCLPLALALGALSPELARLACSEDAHVLGAVFGLAALLAIDVYAARRDRAALVAAVAAAALMVDSRQTYYAWAPCVVAMGAARGGRRLWARPDFILASLAIGLALVGRLVATGVNEPMQVAMPILAFSSARIVGALVVHHPLLDVTRHALPLLPFELVGLFALRRAPMRRAVLALLAVTFVVTLPFGFPLPGVECSFRLPLLLLALALAAAGAELLWSAHVAGRVGVALAVGAPILLPSWRELRRASPVTQEYLFVRDVAARSLGRTFTLAELRAVDPMPAYRLADGALPLDATITRVDVRRLSAADLSRAPVYFLAGVQCRARSALELGGFTQKVETLSADDLRAVLVAPMEHRIVGGAPPPSTMRAECAALLDRAAPAGPESLIAAPDEENPFALYGDAPITLRFYRLTAAPPPAREPSSDAAPLPAPPGPDRK
jgi:hypothetical protein